jgi:hypothetical protein
MSLVIGTSAIVVGVLGYALKNAAGLIGIILGLIAVICGLLENLFWHVMFNPENQYSFPLSFIDLLFGTIFGITIEGILILVGGIIMNNAEG